MEKENVFYSFNEYEPKEVDLANRMIDKRKKKKNAKKKVKYEYTASLNPMNDSTLDASINPGMTFQKDLGTEMTSPHQRTDSDMFNQFKTIEESDEEEDDPSNHENEDDILDFLATPATHKQVIAHKQSDSNEIFGKLKTFEEDEEEEPEVQPWNAGQDAVAVVSDDDHVQNDKFAKKKIMNGTAKRKSNISLKLSEPLTPKQDHAHSEDLRHKMSEMELAIVGYKEDLKQLQIENDGLKEDILFYTKNESKLQTENEKLKREKITDTMLSRQNEEKLKKQINAYKEEKKIFQQNEQKNMAQIEALKKEIQRLKEENPKKLKIERDKIKNENERLSKLDSELQTKSAQIKREISSIQQIFNDANIKIQSIKIDFDK